MIVIILLICGLLASAIAGTILIVQHVNILRGKVIVLEAYNGPAHVSATLLAVLRFLFRRSIYVRKFILQYVAHVAVRMMFYIDKLTTFLYAKSRNWFVRNAVRNRGTVPHFWEHLKVYKQEMDKERDSTEN